jgi:hypothetical protein
MVYLRNWDDEKTRLAGVAKLLQALVKVAGVEKPNVAMAPPSGKLKDAALEASRLLKTGAVFTSRYDSDNYEFIAF